MSSTVPRLYLIADRGFVDDDDAWVRRIKTVAGVLAARRRETGAAIQLRAKGLPAAAREALLLRGLEAARPAGVPLYLNGTLDEVEKLGFDGLHWPEAMIPDPSGPDVGRHDRPIGASVHSAAALRRAEVAGAGFVVYGPVFRPGSKPGRGVGLAALAELSRRASIPVLAVGGIDATAVHQCLGAGAYGVAVVSAVFADDIDRAAALDALLDKL